MREKKFFYQPKARQKTKKCDSYYVRRVTTTIRSIERLDQDTIKIVTQNGTRCTILSKDDDYRYNFQRWKILYKTLQEGDFIELWCFAMKVLNVYVKLSQEFYTVVGFQKMEEEIVLSLNGTKDAKILKFNKTDETPLVFDEYDEPISLFDYDESCFRHGVRLGYIAERLAYILLV